MFEYQGLQDIFFMMLYGAVAFFALLACLYLLLRQGNAFATDVRSSRVLRWWTAAFMVAVAASHVWWYVIGIYWLAVIAVFITYYIYALRQYGRWLLDNYADLERKEVWQSLMFAVGLLVVYEIYTSNAGEMMKEYLSQVISLVIIAFLVWRVETLQELETEE